MHDIYDATLGVGRRRCPRAAPAVPCLHLDLVQHRARGPDHLHRRLHHRPHPAPVAPVGRHPRRPARPVLRPGPPGSRPDGGHHRRCGRVPSCAATGSSCAARPSTASVYLYGDRNRWVKLATLLTHTGLVLFLVAAAITSRFGDEQGLVVAEGESLTVQPIGTPGPAPGPQPGVRGAGVRRDRQGDRLHDPPRGLPGREADRRQDDPRQRPARGRGLHLPPERVRPGARCRDPRRGRQAALDGPDPDDRPGGGLPVRGVRRSRARRRAPDAPPARRRRRGRAAGAAVPGGGHQPRRQPAGGGPGAARAHRGRERHRRRARTSRSSCAASASTRC